MQISYSRMPKPPKQRIRENRPVFDFLMGLFGNEPPSKVKNIEVTKDNGMVLITWDENPEEENVERYDVYASGGGVSWAHVGETQEPELLHEDAESMAVEGYGEASGKIYYRLIAVNSAGESDKTEYVYDYEKDKGLEPETPRDFEISYIGENSVELRWEMIKGASINIYKSTQGGDYELFETLYGVGNYTDRSVSPDRKYAYYLTAENDSGESDPTDELKAKTKEPTSDIPSPTLNAEAVDQNSITLKFFSVDDMTITEIYRDDELIETTRPGELRYTDTGLEPGKVYEYKIYHTKGLTDQYEGPSEDHAMTYPKKPGAPEPPKDLSGVYNRERNMIIVEWDHPNPGEISHYEITVDGEGPIKETSKNLERPYFQKEYTYTVPVNVTAVDQQDKKSESKSVTVSIPGYGGGGSGPVPVALRYGIGPIKYIDNTIANYRERAKKFWRRN